MCQSKAQLVTALSSTKAKPIASVTAEKNIRHVRSVLLELGSAMKETTLVCEDNQSAIKMMEANKLTG